MLIIFGGLPGVGKTTIAKALVKSLKAAYFRVDTVEQVLKREAQLDGPEGYMVCWAQASENLKLGVTVVADSVNAIKVTREAWQNVAIDALVPFLEIELICSNLIEHQKRIETRDADIIGHQLPKWQNVQEREYELWKPHLMFDTSKQTVDEIVKKILMRIKNAA
ncbi:MAG: AAA family ATPase [Legionellaceae bacterium]|nr:AAA family ATPase [Legionellaceae bacterium]